MDVLAELFPLQVLLVSLAGWVSRQQGDVISFLSEENRVLKEQLGGRRLWRSDDQRRRIAAKGQRIGRRLLIQVATIVTPDTILRWHRRLIAAKWIHTSKRVGRPGLMLVVRRLIVRFASENPTWGYCRIQRALANVGNRVSATTIAKTLKEHGIKPAPDRPSSLRVFLKAHWGELAATDFFTVEVWNPRGLRTDYVLFFIRLESRRVHVAGVTANPTDLFMGRAVESSLGFLSGVQYLIHDRDTKSSVRFRLVLESVGIAPIRTPFQAPNANAHAERFVRSIKDECLGRMILLGEGHLRRAVGEYLEHYHAERNHQGFGNVLIDDEPGGEGTLECTDRLGGLLRYYSRAG